MYNIPKKSKVTIKKTVKITVKPKAKKKPADKNWIEKAIKKPGALRKKLGVKEGEKIPAKKLTKATKSKSSTTRKQANLAKTLSKMKKY